MAKTSGDNIQKRREHIQELVRMGKYTFNDLLLKLQADGLEGVSEKSLRSDIEALEYYISGKTGYIRKPTSKKLEIIDELDFLLRSKLIFIRVTETPLTTSTYAYNNEYSDVLPNSSARIIIEENITEKNYCIFLEFMDKGFEQSIADLLYVLYKPYIKLITVGVGGLIIYPCDKRSVDKIIETLKEYI